VARKVYTERDISDALTALAVFNGSAASAERELKEQGLTVVPARTISRWRREKADLYFELQARVRDNIWGEIGDRWRRVAEEAADATLTMVERAHQADDPKEADLYARTARNLATAGGISNDKGRVIDGQPITAPVVPERDEAEIIAKLKRLGVVIEGEAKEVPAPELSEAA